jgi:hypothetical protein
MISMDSRNDAAQVALASIAPNNASVASSPAGSLPWTDPWIHTLSFRESSPLVEVFDELDKYA